MAPFLEKEKTKKPIASERQIAAGGGVSCYLVVAISSTYEGSCKHLEHYWPVSINRHDVKMLLRTHTIAGKPKISFDYTRATVILYQCA